MEPTAGLVLGVALITLSALIHGIRQLTSGGRVDRNSAVGIRTRATQASDSAWAAGHLAAGPWLLATALTGYAAGLLAIVLAGIAQTAGGSGVTAFIIASAGLASVVVLLLISTSHANVAARSALQR